MKWTLLLSTLLFSIFSEGQIITTFSGGGPTTGDGGPATAALINDPCQLNFDRAGNLYIASGVDYRIRKISPTGLITTIAGTGVQGYSGDNGPATAAQFNFPNGVALDTSGNIFVSDDLYGSIRKIDAATGIITTICGNDVAGYSGDNGPATAAKLYGPLGICFDRIGNLYIADDENNVVRKINSSGIITTVAGTGTYGYNGDGIIATNAQLYSPSDVQADDSGNIYIADGGNARIRKVDTSGIISTYAGTGVATYIGDGMPATSAQFTCTWIKFDHMNNLFISDGTSLNPRVYKIDHSTGIFYSVAGNGSSINAGDGGPATAASFAGYPSGIAFDECDNLYIGNIASSGDSDRIRKVTFNPATTPTITLSGPSVAATGTLVTVNATVVGAGSGYSIKWYNGGTLFNTTTLPSVTYTHITGTDYITAVVLPASPCIDSAT